jgi:hypothetical protein
MQIGQILIEQRWVDPEALRRGLAEQRLTGMRICSLLIGRDQLDPDHAARALAAQHRVPGALQRHLEFRERRLAALLPAAVAHACIALPIGRTRHGELIVCVRDPDDATRAAIAAAIAGPVVIAVAPARQLEQLVHKTYAAAMSGVPEDLSVDVDLTTRPIELPILGAADARDELGALGALDLVELDDARVTKDPSQSGPILGVRPRKP